jgi:predicted enzyme related to lactoylglutathione lyase
MLHFTSILLSTENHTQLAEFYTKVFEKEPEMRDESYTGFLVGKCFFSIGQHSKVLGKNTNPDRILFNFETEDVKGEFERIKALGAGVVKEPYTMEGWEGWIATLSDPDGNYFQLMTPWKDTK